LTFKQHSNESVYIVFNVRILNVSPGYTCIHSLCSFLESLTVHLVAFEYQLCVVCIFPFIQKSPQQGYEYYTLTDTRFNNQADRKHEDDILN